MADSPQLKARVAGKWQIPLLMLSLGALASALWTARTQPEEYPVADALAQIDALLAEGAHEPAARMATTLLRRSEFAPEDLAPIHLRLARALSAVAKAAAAAPEDIHRRIVVHYAFAEEHAETITSDDHESWAAALEQEKLAADAVNHLDEAFELSAESKWDCVRRALTLRRKALRESADELAPRLERVLTAAAAGPELRVWALEEMVTLLHDDGRVDEAVTLIARHRDSVDSPQWKDTIEYLTALSMVRGGAADEADLLVRALHARQAANDPNGARCAWLLGRIMLGADGRDRPSEAIAHFEESLRASPRGAYAAASRLGLAEALTGLERDGEAIEQYRQALAQLAEAPESHEIDADVVRTSLIQQAGLARVAGRLRSALDYLDVAGAPQESAGPENAAGYWELRGEIAEGLARKTRGDIEDRTHAGESVEARDWEAVSTAFKTAGGSFLELARLGVLDERRAADAQFRAAEMFAEASERTEAARLFASIAAEHPLSPSVGHALLRLGQVRQANGEFQEALAAYRECVSRFSGTLYGSQALIPLAETYLAIADGTEELDQAEDTLGQVLEGSELFRPESREFVDALFLRGQIASLKGEHDRAIAILTEALDRYPSDERRLRARFLLADAYRQSGLALKEAAKQAVSAGEGAQIREDYLARLSEARKLFREVIDAFESRSTQLLDRLEGTYYRHGLLFEADCLFEAMLYADALKLYQSAAGTLADTPAVLATYVQIINCHVFLGQSQDARTALTRALVQLDRIPDASFEQTYSKETKADWKRYFEWLDKSELF
ncbi:MAG: tetratricopeptide repeat protein [Phycisphaerales bacterium]|nr:tetratricopeptide repeat protein [Phycisphaerales bacterium]